MSTALNSIRRNRIAPFFGDRLFDSVFNSFFDTPFYSVVDVAQPERSLASPQYNVIQNDTGYEISVAVPGLDKSDIDVNVEANVLTISHSQKENTASTFACSSFSRSWRLPEGTEIDNIDATYDKGILTLSVPTVDAGVSNRKIEVK